VKTITSRIEQAADAQLQRQFHGFLEVFAYHLMTRCLVIVAIANAIVLFELVGSSFSQPKWPARPFYHVADHAYVLVLVSAKCVQKFIGVDGNCRFFALTQ